MSTYAEAAGLEGFPVKITNLIDAGSAYTGFLLPGYFRRYARRKQISHSIRPEAWLRILGTQPAPRKAPDSRQSATLQRLDVSDIEAATHGFLVSRIRACLDGKQRDIIKTRLGDLHEQALGSHSEMPGTLLNWVEHLLEHPNAVGTRLQAATLQSYVSVVGQRLLEALNELETNRDNVTPDGTAAMDWTDPQQLSQLYALVLDDADSANHRKHMVRALREFHAYIRLSKIGDADAAERTGRLPDNERYDFESIARQAAEVDANVLRYDEYQAIRQAIGQERYRWQKHPDYRRIAECLVILGYRCGLRRSESLYLRLGDFLTGGNARSEILEIWVQAYPGRTLKTPNARRRLPVQVLLTDEERQVLAMWYDLKRNSLLETSDDWHQARLFSPRGQAECPIQDDSEARYLYSGIRAIMNEVTGDPSLRYHHFRHSLGTWLLTALQWLGGSQKEPQMEEMLGEWVETARRVNDQLLRGSGGQRKHLYFVSMLLGHSTPAISLEHYLHCQDLLLAARLGRQSFTYVAHPDQTATHPHGKSTDLFADGHVLASLGFGDADYLRQRLNAMAGAGEYLRTRRATDDDAVVRHLQAYQAPGKSCELARRLNLLHLFDAVRTSLTGTTRQSEGLTNELSDEQLDQCRARLLQLNAATGKNNIKTKRHPLVAGWINPSANKPVAFPRKAAEKRVFEALTRQFEANLLRHVMPMEKVEHALRIFAENSRQQTAALVLRSPEDANCYLDFHRELLGFTAEEIVIELTLAAELSQNAFQEQYQRWQQALGENCPPPSHVTRRTKQGNSQGRILFNIRLNHPDSSQENDGLFGYRYGMTLMFISWPLILERAIQIQL